MNQAAQKLNLFDDEPGLFEQQPLPKPVAAVAKPAVAAKPAAVAKPIAPAPVQRAKVEKSPTAHRTISEVAEDLDVPQHVLRFWETKFAQLRPLKRAGGRRYYRTEDITLIRHIHSLLYAQGYTIKGAQKVLKEKQPPAIAPAVTVVDKPVEVSANPAPKTDPYKELREMLIELKALRALV